MRAVPIKLINHEGCVIKEYIGHPNDRIYVAQMQRLKMATFVEEDALLPSPKKRVFRLFDREGKWWIYKETWEE